MSENKLLRIPAKDPVDGGNLFVSELTGEHSGISIRGRFAIPRYSKLDDEQANFLETFLRCRGMLNSVEKELGLSYPTVRSRLDGLLDALGLEPVKERGTDAKKEKARKVLDLLEQGEISAEEAKQRLKSEEGS